MTSFRGILGQSSTLKFHKVKLLKFQNFNLDIWTLPIFLFGHGSVAVSRARSEKYGFIQNKFLNKIE